ncbi:LOW QUALITY PROTEIN: EF-hand calcium-binding domain-containing protein 11 [Rhynochetos jubatus]
MLHPNHSTIPVSRRNINSISAKTRTSREDFKVAVVLLFGCPSKVEVDSFIKRGFFTFKDFKTFNSVSPKLSERIRVEAFREVDQDSDGRISFKEFESAMKYGQDEVSPVYFA